MAENVTPLVLPVKVDATQLTSGVQAIKNALNNVQDYSFKAAISIEQISNSSIIAANGLTNLSNQAIQSANAIYQVGMAASRARITMTSLSLVAQDLPFGFIAIQNNLPILIQQFALLRAESKGTMNALRELGHSLMGPSGIFLGFSAITALIAYSVKKYGSLETAFEALVGKANAYADAIKKAEEAQKDFSKSAKTISELQNQASGSYEVSALKLQALSKIVLDETKSEYQRKNALEQLKDLDKDRFKNYDLEKTSLQNLTKTVDDYTNALIANAIAKEYESELAKTTINLNNQRDALFKLQKELDNITSAYPDIADKAAEFNKTTKKFTIPKKIEDYNNLIKKIAEQTDVVTNVEFPRTEELRKKFEDAISDVNNYYKVSGKGGKDGNALKVSIDTQDLDEAFNLEKIITNITNYGNTLLDVTKIEKQRKEALKELIAINPEFANTLSLNKSMLNDNKNAIENNIKSLKILIQQRAFDKRSNEINNQFLKDQEELREKNIKVEEKELESLINLSMAYDNISNSTNKVVKSNNDFLDQLAFGQEVIEMLNKALNLEDIYDKALKNLVNFSEYQQKEIEKISKDFRYLQQPIEGLFTTALEGAGANWKAFADDVIKQIKRITAALLAKSLIKGLANLLAPGIGGLIGGGLSGISDTGLADFLSNTGGQRINFEGLQGGMQMTGQVVFVQRGSDLVGVLNRTNSTINRIG